MPRGGTAVLAVSGIRAAALLGRGEVADLPVVVDVGDRPVNRWRLPEVC